MRAECPGGILTCPHFRFVPEALQAEERAERGYETAEERAGRHWANPQTYAWRQCWAGGSFKRECRKYCEHLSCIIYQRTGREAAEADADRLAEALLMHLGCGFPHKCGPPNCHPCPFPSVKAALAAHDKAVKQREAVRDR